MKAQGRRRTREGRIHNVKSSYSMAILIILQCHTLKHHQPHITCREKGHKLHHKASSYLVLFSKFIYILPAMGMPFANNNDLKQVCFDVKEQQKLGNFCTFFFIYPSYSFCYSWNGYVTKLLIFKVSLTLF